MANSKNNKTSTKINAPSYTSVFGFKPSGQTVTPSGVKYGSGVQIQNPSTGAYASNLGGGISVSQNPGSAVVPGPAPTDGQAYIEKPDGGAGTVQAPKDQGGDDGVTDEGVVTGGGNSPTYGEMGMTGTTDSKDTGTDGGTEAPPATEPTYGEMGMTGTTDAGGQVSSEAPAPSEKPPVTETPGDTGTTDSKNTDNTGNTGGTTDNAMTYEEFFANEKANEYKRADEAYARAEKDAGISRERAMVDAQNSYRQNMAGYGANAEALAGMGLSGGGYSEYLNAQAYATQRGEVQDARAGYDNAIRQAGYARDDAKSQADTRYSTNMFNLGQSKNQTYMSLLSGANSGAYSAEQLSQLGKDMGLSEEQISSLVSAAEAYDTQKTKLETDTQNQTLASILASAGSGAYSALDDESIRRIMELSGYTNEADIQAVIDANNGYKSKADTEEKAEEESQNAKLYSDFEVLIESGEYAGVSDETLRNQLIANGLSEEQADALVEKNRNINIANNASKYNSVNEIIASGMSSEDVEATKEEIIKQKEQKYSEYYNAGDYSSAGGVLDEMYAGGFIKEGEYQRRYGLVMQGRVSELQTVDDVVNFVSDLTDMFNGETLEDGRVIKRIKEYDYNGILNILRKKYIGPAIPRSSIDLDILSTNAINYIDKNGNTRVSEKADKSLAKTLTKIYGNDFEGSVIIDGYTYSLYHGEWRKFKDPRI